MLPTIPFRTWNIAYERRGSGSPLLFLHNGGTSHRIWRDVMNNLQSDYDVIAIDLLGYGESSKPGHSYTMDVYVDLVVTVLDTFQIDRVTLVGNCMGSAISLHMAHQHPERIRGLILINPLTEATFNHGWLAPVLKARQASPNLVGRAYKTISNVKLPQWTAPGSLAFQIGKAGRQRGIHKDGELQQLHASKGQLRSMLDVLADIDAYAEIDAPGFVTPDFPPIYTIWGEDNRVLSAKAGARLNKTLEPHASCTIPECGHLVMMESPDKVANHMRQYLQELHS